MISSVEILYAINQGLIRTGDTGWVNNKKNLLSWLICRATGKGFASHVFTVEVKHGQAYAHEALMFRGIKVRPLSVYLDNKNVELVFAKTQLPVMTGNALRDLTIDERCLIIKWENEQADKPYDYKALFGILWDAICGRRDDDNELADTAERRFICSRFVARCHWKLFGLRLLDKALESTGNLSPNGLALSPYFQFTFSNAAGKQLWEDWRAIGYKKRMIYYTMFRERYGVK